MRCRVPLQVSQLSSRRILTSVSVPKIASSKLDREIEAQIVAATLPRTSLLRSAHVEHLAEQVAEDVAQVDTAAEATEAARAATAHTRVAKSIVGSALVRIAQHLVRLARLFELLFCGVIARIAVRMILQRQLAISALQLLVAGFTRNAQNLVVICFAHSRICTHSFLSALLLIRWSALDSRLHAPAPAATTSHAACSRGEFPRRRAGRAYRRAPPSPLPRDGADRTLRPPSATGCTCSCRKMSSICFTISSTPERNCSAVPAAFSASSKLSSTGKNCSTTLPVA